MEYPTNGSERAKGGFEGHPYRANDLPFLTREFAGVGGTIKNRPEDFFVQELPLYEPSGVGEHVYCEVQKVNITTFEAMRRLGAGLRVPLRDIGYAGLKDAHAMARQIFSVRGRNESEVMGIRVPDLTVQWAARHGNKLRLGHLLGNRFAIKVRDVVPTDVVRLKPLVSLLQRRGMPNYFGEQRFGRRGDNDRLGAALVRGNDDEVLKVLLGQPDPMLDSTEAAESRRAFEEGDFQAALCHLPRGSGMERRVLERLIKTGRAHAAVASIDQRLRRLWISALQSRLFNDVVARRIDSLDRVMEGDVAYKHENGACFRVEDASAEQERCERFEISPTGPLLGYRMMLPEGAALRMEAEVFAAAGLSPADFRSEHLGKVKGARRPLRVKPADIELAAGVDEHGAHITVAFTLPAGSFATIFLRELMKTEPQPAAGGAEKIDEICGDSPASAAPDESMD